MLSYAPIEEGSEGIIGFAIAAFLMCMACTFIM